MSPSEADLRAALHDGDGGDGDDGDRPSVNVVIAIARTRRARRRTQLLGSVAVAAVIAGGGFGLAQLGGTEQNSSNVNAGTAGGAVGYAGQGSAARQAPALAAGPACPATAPRYALAGGGSPGQFGSGGTMFDKPVSALVVCAFGPGSGSGVTRVVLRGGDATGVVSSVENAAKRPSTQPCPAYKLADSRQLAMTGVAADGSTTRTVTAPLGVPACATTVTNGTAIRYDWSPPAALLTSIAKTSPGGVEHASPIQS